MIPVKYAKTLYALRQTGDTCTWYGTEWEGEGTQARLKPCGKPAVGTGLFEDISGINGVVHDLCEAHSKRGRDVS